MDIGITPDVAVGVGGLSWVGVLISYVAGWRKDMQLERRLCAIEKTARESAAGIEKRLDAQDDEIASHALLDAQTYVSKTEFTNLVNHMDKQFTETRQLIIDMIRDGNGRKRSRNAN